MLLCWILLGAQEVDIPSLIRKLGSDRFAERAEAAEALAGAGRKAIPALSEAAAGVDPEVALRARELLERIQEPGFFDGRRGERGGEGEAALRAALGWLARHQAPDGSWGATACPRCPQSEAEDRGAGVLGLSLLAFLGAGIAPGSEDKAGAEAVRKGLARLAEAQDVEGALGPRGVKFMYGQAIGGTALAEAAALTGEERWKAAAQRAADFTVAAQNPGRGWRYLPRSGESDTSVTFWAALQLLVARKAGLRVAEAAFDGARGWMKEVTDTQGYGMAGYLARGEKPWARQGVGEEFDRHESMGAISLFIRLQLGESRTARGSTVAADVLLHDLPSSKKAMLIDYYYWHVGSLAVLHADGLGGPRWKLWSAALQKTLLPLQKREGCGEGSWDAADRWSLDGGRVYATALNALTLETGYRYRVR